MLKSTPSAKLNPLLKFLDPPLRNVWKRTFGHVQPAKIQTKLHIRAVRSEPSLGASWIAKDAKLLNADNEDCDQTARMRGTCRTVRFSCYGSFFLFGKLPRYYVSFLLQYLWKSLIYQTRYWKMVKKILIKMHLNETSYKKMDLWHVWTAKARPAFSPAQPDRNIRLPLQNIKYK